MDERCIERRPGGAWDLGEAGGGEGGNGHDGVEEEVRHPPRDARHHRLRARARMCGAGAYVRADARVRTPVCVRQQSSSVCTRAQAYPSTRACVRPQCGRARMSSYCARVLCARVLCTSSYTS